MAFDWKGTKPVAAVMTAALVATLLVLWLGNPYSQTWWLKCPLHVLTGWQCPLCGMQRQLHALMHGQWVEAWRLNAALFFFYPYAACAFMAQLSRRFRLTRPGRWCLSGRVMAAVLVLMAGWGIVRNLL